MVFVRKSSTMLQSTKKASSLLRSEAFARSFVAWAQPSQEIATPPLTPKDSPFLKFSEPNAVDKGYDKLFASIPETKVSFGERGSP